MPNEIDLTHYVVPKVAKAVLSESKISFIYGWRDGSKSTSAFRVLIWKCLLDKHFRWAHCRAKYNEIQGSTFQTIQDEIKAMCLQDYFIVTKDKFKIINKKNPDNYFFGASADQPDKIRSTPNLNGYIVDEAHDITEKDFASLTGTLRENEAMKTTTKAIYIFNNDKVSIKSFLYTSFFHPEAPMYNKVERVMVNYLDNRFVNQEKTKEKLMMVVLNDEAKYNSLMNGEFIVEKPQNPFFYALDRDKHYAVNDIIWNKTDVLYLAFDFNISPMTCVVAQLKPGVYLNIIKSYKIRNITIKEFCGQIKRDFPGAIFKVTADPAGNSRSVGYDSVTTTMHSIIRQSLNIGLNQMDKPMLNWNRRDAWQEIRIFCNSVLQHHPNINISPKAAIELINDLEMATTIENEDKLYKTSGDTEFGMHLTDCFIYLLTTYFNTYLKRQL